MVIYWDLVVITNLIIDYAFLKTIAVIFKEKIGLFRMIFSLILGSLSILLFLMPVKYLYNLRYVIGIMMGMVAYKVKKPEKRLLMITCFYIINLVFIGSLVIFEIKSIFLLLVTMFYVIILTMIEKALNNKVKIEKEYVVTIKDKHLKGLFDTGNKCYYKNKPVVFLENTYFSEEFIFIDELEIDVINSKQIIKIYNGPKILVNNYQYEVYYSFTNIEEYDIILNNSIGG